jgi:hypothetical protein
VVPQRDNSFILQDPSLPSQLYTHFSTYCVRLGPLLIPPRSGPDAADDLGYDDINMWNNNHSVALTPNLNQLAQNGVILSNHHVQPFCSPTRATILTGRHVLR